MEPAARQLATGPQSRLKLATWLQPHAPPCPCFSLAPLLLTSPATVRQGNPANPKCNRPLPAPLPPTTGRLDLEDPRAERGTPQEPEGPDCSPWEATRRGFWSSFPPQALCTCCSPFPTGLVDGESPVGVHPLGSLPDTGLGCLGPRPPQPSSSEKAGTLSVLFAVSGAYRRGPAFAQGWKGAGLRGTHRVGGRVWVGSDSRKLRVSGRKVSVPTPLP